MGQLLRRYWHPVGATSQLKERRTLLVRILGEDLVLYRDLSGSYGLVAHQCPHRKMSLVYGIPEDTGLRCAYHGWRFDETGRCLEQPYEETEDPAGSFRDKVTITAYPVQQLGGMLFAYLGPEPAPLLPNWDLFVAEGVVRDVGHAALPCNWLQIMENSLDPVHVEWLHQGFFNFVADRLGRPDLQRPSTPHRQIAFDLFDYGIIKRRVVGEGSEEDDDWRIGHPIVFPNLLKTGNLAIKGRGANFQIRVPIDDTHTAHWWYSCYSREPGQPEQLSEDVPFYRVPVPVLDEDGQPSWEELDNTSGQDIAAWITQGQIADRTDETLGRSDRGIILYRRLLEEQMALVEDGVDPLNVFRDPDENRDLNLQTEGVSARYAKSLLTGRRAATKFSPVLAAQGYASDSSKG